MYIAVVRVCFLLWLLLSAIAIGLCWLVVRLRWRIFISDLWCVCHTDCLSISRYHKVPNKNVAGVGKDALFEERDGILHSILRSL